MGQVFIDIKMVQFTKVSGKKINSMGMEKKSGLMELYMKDIIMKERNMVKGSYNLLISLSMKVNFI